MPGLGHVEWVRSSNILTDISTNFARDYVQHFYDLIVSMNFENKKKSIISRLISGKFASDETLGEKRFLDAIEGHISYRGGDYFDYMLREFGGTFLRLLEISVHFFYVLSLIDNDENLIRRMRGDFVRGTVNHMDNEFSVMIHFLKTGAKVKPNFLYDVSGPDMFCEKYGYGVNVECKTISDDIGLAIKGRELELLAEALDVSYIQEVIKNKLICIVIKGAGLEKGWREQVVSILAEPANLLIEGPQKFGDSLEIEIFVSDVVAETKHEAAALRQVYEAPLTELTGISNPHGLFQYNKELGAVAILFADGSASKVASRVERTLIKTVKSQIPEDEAGSLWVRMAGLDARSLESLATNHQSHDAPNTLMFIANKIFSKYPHMINVTFLPRFGQYSQIAARSIISSKHYRGSNVTYGFGNPNTVFPKSAHCFFPSTEQ